MNIFATPLSGLFLIQPKIFSDERGYFLETFKQTTFEKAIGPVSFVQENESKSSFGVLRGLHYQKPPFTQSKLVRCIQGSILDVVVDLRSSSPTYQQTFSVILDSEKKNQLFVPRGFAHGFVVLSDSAIFAYKVDNPYSPQHEAGIRYDDPELLIDWMLSKSDLKLSAKDQFLPFLSETQIPEFR
ncbi:MAG: dTDP-4-dehydrorhamnose 3,5-epimerase [Marinilabiliales bacterium]|nr:dTDP-4-dehydrorhamnose 3,5-epimerase [Marinilabiliales bacterium]